MHDVAQEPTGFVKFVPDEELARLAEEAGPCSAAAEMLRALKTYRAKDRQVFAYHIDDCFFIGPMPDARLEAELLALADIPDVAS